MGFFDFLRKSGSAQERILATEEFNVSGVYYYLDDLYKLSVRNDSWKKQTKALLNEGKAGKRIFRYNFINKPVKLIPEPKNVHDKNAIIVQIAGEKVGYINAEETRRVKKILSKNEVKYITAFISGGEYKIPQEDGTFFKDEIQPSIKIKIAYVEVKKGR